MNYNYDKDTKEYLSSNQGQNDPLENKELLSANATFTEPPAVATGEVAVFENNTWIVKTDKRGTTIYNTSDKTSKVIDYIGDVESGYTETAPQSFETWNGANWETDLAEYKKTKIAELETNKQAIFTDNYSTSAQQNDNFNREVLKDYREAGNDLSEDQLDELNNINNKRFKIYTLTATIKTKQDEINAAVDESGVNSVDLSLTW
jgi:hypothetical protein